MSSSSAYIKRREPVPESHPRQWVDVFKFCPTSKGPSLCQNPTHGSGWMSSSSAYIKRPEPMPESHPRQWVNVFKFCLHQKARGCARIPPTAVGGCLQDQAAISRHIDEQKVGLELSTHCRGWDSRSYSPSPCRLDLKTSTHCRGWDSRSYSPSPCRLDLKTSTHCRGWPPTFSWWRSLTSAYVRSRARSQGGRT
jgi:hypothetical protein